MVKLAKTSDRGHDPDKLIYSLFIIVFIFSMTTVAVLIPNFRPSDRLYVASSIAYSYYYASTALALLASLFLNHGVIIDKVIVTDSSRSGNEYVDTALSEYYRLRYIYSLVNLFNYAETKGSYGKYLMSIELHKALIEGYNDIKDVGEKIGVFKSVPSLIDEVKSMKILRLRKEIYDELKEINQTSSLPKTIETRILKIYKNIVEKSAPGKEVKQLRGELKNVMKNLKKIRKESTWINKLYSLLEKPETLNIDEFIEIEPVKLRYLRNFLVHGKLSRQYVIYNDRILDNVPLLEEPVKLYIVTSLLLVFFSNKLIRREK